MEAGRRSAAYEAYMRERMKEYIMCPECPRCRPEDTLRNGVKWGICKMGGNIVYLEPWEEKKINGRGYIHHGVSSCRLYKKKGTEE